MDGEKNKANFNHFGDGIMPASRSLPSGSKKHDFFSIAAIEKVRRQKEKTRATLLHQVRQSLF